MALAIPTVTYADEVHTEMIAPAQATTASQSRCEGPTMSTPGISCIGFDGTQVRGLTDLFVLGFENNKDLSEKHVLQTVVSFDLSSVSAIPQADISGAKLHYAEASTTTRSATGDSQYGILTSCNTRLGIPAASWDGSLDKVVPTTAALTAGMTPATTGDAGSWDVTPQIRAWLAQGQSRGVFVMRGDDESMDIRDQSLCLSYVIDLNLTVDHIVHP